jgi:hypothetical protein
MKEKSYEKYTYKNCLDYPSFALFCGDFTDLCAFARKRCRTGERCQGRGIGQGKPNPIANLISVPFQNNFNFGIGPKDATQWDLNVQPVIPITLNKDWNLITRTIMPIINQPFSRSRDRERVRARRH